MLRPRHLSGANEHEVLGLKFDDIMDFAMLTLKPDIGSGFLHGAPGANLGRVFLNPDTVCIADNFRLLVDDSPRY